MATEQENSFFTEFLARLGGSIKDAGDGWTECVKPPIPGHNIRFFGKEVEDGALLAVVELRIGRDDPVVFPNGRWHLSISHNKKIKSSTGGNIPGRMPSWDDLKEARYKFLPDNANFATMFPPKEIYYNLHPTCLHLLEIPVELALKKNQGL